MKSKILTLSLSVLAFSISGIDDASAAHFFDVYSIASSELTWDGLTTTGDMTPYTFFHSLSKARTADFWDIENQNSWVIDMKYSDHNTNAPSETIFENSGVASEGETSSNLISSSSEAGIDYSSYGEYSGEARAMKGQTYHVGQVGGTVTFRIPYSLYVDTYIREITYDAYSYARAWSWLRLWNQTTKTWDKISGTYTFEDITGLGRESDTLLISYNAAPGSYILLEAGADTRVAVSKSVVPVPPSVLMLLSGFGGLYFLRRRS